MPMTSPIRWTTAARSLLRSPGFSLAAVLTIALGIGINTTLFSVVDGVLLKPLPFPQAERLVRIQEHDRELGAPSSVSVPTFFDWRQQARSFSLMAAYQEFPGTLTGDGEPEHILTAIVSPALFPLLGVELNLGRPFTAEDEAKDTASVVLGHELWQRRFGGRPDVIGRSLVLDGQVRTVIGVLPAGLELPGTEAELWRPLFHGALMENRGSHLLRVLGRIQPEATMEAAQAEMNVIAAGLEAAYPEDMKGYDARVVPWLDLLVGPVRARLLLLFGAAGLVLLIGCANVANLLLARLTARRREVAVRAALGAGRRELVGFLLGEAACLALAGGALGLLIAQLALSALKLAAPEGLPRLAGVELGGRAFGFSFAVIALITLLTSLPPAWQTWRASTPSWLRSVGGGGARVSASGPRSLLVVFQVALAVVLLGGAGLFARSLASVVATDPGFRPAGVVTARLNLPERKYVERIAGLPTMPKVDAAVDALLEHLRAIPGARSVALAYLHPLSPGWTSSFSVVGEPAPREEPYFRPVSPGYFETVGTALVRGRLFTADDRGNAPRVVIANQAFVRRFFPDRDPLGLHLVQWGQDFELVGIVGDERFLGMAEGSAPALYFPFSQRALPEMALLVRSDRDAASLLADMRHAVSAVDPDFALYEAGTLEGLLSESLAPRQFNTFLLSAFAGLAMVLAAVGLYGLLAYLVAARRGEMGIRLACGAQREQILGLVVRRALTLVAAGGAVGLVAALGLRHLVASFLFGVSASDPVTLASVLALLTTTALAASALPAYRASRLDPSEVLRGE